MEVAVALLPLGGFEGFVLEIVDSRRSDMPFQLNSV